MAEEHTYAWKDTQGEGGYNWKDLHPKLMNIGDQHEFGFEINRQRNDGLSFSAQAVEALARGCMTFFLSRVTHHFATTGKMAQKARIIIRVELED